MKRALVVLLLSLAESSGYAHSVVGSVIDRESQIPIGNVTVFLISPSRQYRAISDEKGAFRVETILPENYQVLMQWEESFFPSISVIVDSQPIDREYRLDLKLPLGKPGRGTINGRVVLATGEPAFSARITLILGPGISSAVTSTDASGNFTFRDVVSANYKLLATPKPASDNAESAYVSTFSDVVIPIRGDADVGEIRLQLASVHRISGRIADREGRSVPGETLKLHSIVQAPLRVGVSWEAMFRLSPEENVQGPEESSVISDKDGLFIFPSVRSGEWLIVGENGWEARITVTDRDIENVEMRPLFESSLPGELIWTTFCVNGRLSCGNRRSAGVMLPLQLRLTGGTRATRLVMTGENGAFQMETPPVDSYRLEPLFPLIDGKLIEGTLYQGWDRRAIVPLSLRFSVSMAEGGQTMLDVERPLLAFEATGLSLKKTLSATVQGQVTGEGDGAVIFVPEDEIRAGILSFPHSNGQFTASGLSAGTYYVAAFHNLNIGNLRSFGLVEQTKRVGKKIRIEMGNTSLGDFTWNEWPD